MDSRKQAALEVILAALAMREEDGPSELDVLHTEIIDAALSAILKPVEIVCHFEEIGAWDEADRN